MANLRGFPPSNTISPSVRITEKDLSFIPTAPTLHRAAVVGFASKGPINVPTVVNNVRQLHTVFGYPHPESSDPYMVYAGEQFLAFGNELYVVRVADDTAETAEVCVPPAGDVVRVIGGETEPYVFGVDQFFRWRLNGVLASKILVVPAETYTAQELADELNAQLEPEIDGIEFYVHDSDTIALRTVWAYGTEATVELVSVMDSIYGGAGSVVGMGTDMTQAELQGLGEADFVFAEASILQIIVDGTANNLIDNVVQTVDVPADTYTAEQMRDLLNDAITNGDVPGGWEADGDGDFVHLRTLTYGRDARIRVRAGAVQEALGLSTTAAMGVSPADQAEDVETLGIIRGSKTPASGDDCAFLITADSPGIEGNETTVVIKNNIYEGIFNLEVYHRNVQVESWGNLSMDPNSSYYVETFIATHSDYIRCEVVSEIPPRDSSEGYELAGGSDGLPDDPDEQDALIIGNIANYTGLYAISEPEQIDIDIVAVPGHSSTAVIQALIRLCEEFRRDCIAIVDPPFGMTVTEIVQWHNGVHPLNTSRFNSDFAALYWPWVKIFDAYNRVPVWVPPSGSILAVYARSDSMSEPWFPPAGETRGVVPGIIDVFSRPSLQERDDMYANRNAINPIIQFVDNDNYVVWGQKTLQRRPTALDRVNVRRMLFSIQKRIRSRSRAMLFEPHDEKFRTRWVAMANEILADVGVKRGLVDYIIQADEELNTPDVIDRNEFRARIGVQPTRAVEFIFIEFSIHRTGSFEITD